MRVRWVGLLAAATVAAAGCTSGSGSGGAAGKTKLTGVVKLNGTPLTYGRVEFHMASGGRVVKAVIGSDGTYNISEPPTGPAKVVVVAGEPPVAAAAAGAAGPPPKFVKVTIPDEYGSPEKTPLTYTITDGPQTHEVLVKS